jgi:toxin CptA
VVLWQSDLRVSWRSQWFSLLLHGVVAALVLLMPWPLSYTPLAAAAVAGGFRQRAQPAADPCPSGEIKLLMDSRLRWQNAEWDILGRRGCSTAA